MNYSWCLVTLLFGITNASLYGIYVNNVQNENIVYTVKVDLSTGNFTFLAKNFVYVGDAFVYNGISTFDTKKQILYYGLNLNSDYVESIDVANLTLQPPVSIGAVQLDEIVRDTPNNQLFITGTFADNSSAIYSIPDSGQASEVLNLTKAGMGTVVAAVLNQTAAGDQYIFIHVNSKYQFQLANFAISNPKELESIAFPCGTQWQPLYLAVDNQKLLGITGNSAGNDYAYFEIVGGKCLTKNLKLSGNIISATYDPTEQVIYMSYSGLNGGSTIEIYNTSSYSLSSIPSFDVLADIEVSV